jgi:hypothetical protein
VFATESMVVLYPVVVCNCMRLLDWTKIITREVLSRDKKCLGHVDGLEDTEFIVKDGLIKPKYYKIPRDRVEGYREGKVLLGISEQDVKKQFRRNNPGYFKD